MADSKIVLGLDVSTTCTGISIVSDNGEGAPKVELIDKCKFKIPTSLRGTTDSLFYKSKQFKDLMVIQHDIGLTDIVIEEPLPNSQNRNTLTTLLRFNGMLSQLIFDATGIIPHYISSYDARCYALPELMAVRKFNKKGEVYDYKHIQHALKKSEIVLFGNYPWDCAKKDIIWNLISEKYPDIEWSYNKKGELVKENYDASDALVCALGYLTKMKYPDDKPQVVETLSSTIGSGAKIRFDYKFKFIGKTHSQMLYI